jgi:hypothetical protein
MTSLVKWAVGLTLAFAVLVGMGFLPPFRPWGQYRLAGGILFTCGGVCGLASGITSATALLFKHERSRLLYVTLIPGFLVLLVALLEVTE